MSDERIKISSICSATNWWLEIRSVESGKLLRRLPIAAWAVTKDQVFKAICYAGDAKRFFCTDVGDEEDGLEYSLKHGTNLKQIGTGIWFEDEIPKRIRKKGKK